MEKVLKCKDCGEDFIFTDSEQELFAELQFADPVRCVKCRRAKKMNFKHRPYDPDRKPYENKNRV
jgi:hypothetical protein